MKFLKLALLSIPFVMTACFESTSSADSYGDLIYERKSPEGRYISRECHVYATDSRFIFEGTAYAGSLGPMNYFSEIKIGSKMKVKDEFRTSDSRFADAMEEECAMLKQTYAQFNKPSVTCSDKEVLASGEVDNVLSHDYLTSYMKDACDKYIEEVVDGNYEKASSCTVRSEGNVAYMDVVYATKSASLKATYLGNESGMMEETYTGVSADTLAMVCEYDKAQPGYSDVRCDGATISHKETKANVTIENMIAAFEVTCDALRNGLVPFERVMFGE